MTKKDWEFTPKRRKSMQKAQKKHSYYVKLGEKAEARGMRL